MVEILVCSGAYIRTWGTRVVLFEWYSWFNNKHATLSRRNAIFTLTTATMPIVQVYNNMEVTFSFIGGKNYGSFS